MKESFVGRTFGRLTVLSRAEDYQYPNHPERGWYKQWECRCECGNVVVKLTQGLLKPKHPCCGECPKAVPVYTPPPKACTVPVIVQPAGVLPLPVGSREWRPAGYIIRIGEEIWTASDSLRGILEYAVETTQARKTTLCFSNGIETTQVRDYRERAG